jgi:hypothetical protein
VAVARAGTSARRQCVHGNDTSTQRPNNWLLQQLPDRDYRMIGPDLVGKTIEANHVIWHPGDDADSIFFPCGATLISLAVSVAVGHEVHALAIGSEGVVGAVDRRPMPTYSRCSVLIGGDGMRLSLTKYNHAMRRSPAFRKLMESYASYMFEDAAGCCLQRHSLQRATCSKPSLQ